MATTEEQTPHANFNGFGLEMHTGEGFASGGAGLWDLVSHC